MMAYNFWKDDSSPIVPRRMWRTCWVTAAVIVACGAWSLHRRPATWPAVEADNPPAPVLETRINPNVADAASLCRLPGIGPARANDIIAYREHYRQTHGPDAIAFTRPEDLAAIKGIGSKTVERLKSLLIFK